MSALAFSAGPHLLSTGIQFPNVTCAFRLDPRTLLPFSATAVGAASLPVPVPSASALSGLILRIQALTIGGAAQFSNVASVQVFS